MSKLTHCFTSRFWVVFVVALSLYGATYPVFAEEPGEDTASVKFSGEFRTRGFYTHDLLPGDEAFGDMRFRLKTKASSEYATGVIVADFVNGYCAPSVATVQSALPLDSGLGTVSIIPDTIDDATGCPVGKVSTGNGRFGTGTAFGHSLNIVGVQEAYLLVSIKDFKVAAGRKYYRLGHGMVLSDTATGGAGRKAFGPVTVTVADLNLGDPVAIGVGTGTANDSDFYLLKVTDTPPAGSSPYGKEKYHAYFGWLTDPNGNLTYNSHGAGSFGANFEAKLGLIGWALNQYSYRTGGPVIDFEWNYIWGDVKGAGAADPKISGMSAMAGSTIGPLGLTFVYGSGQNPAKNPAAGGDLNVNALSANYTLGNILLDTSKDSDREGGSPDIGRRGLMALKGSYKIMDTESHSMDVSAIVAKTTEDASATVTSHDLGVEIDGNAAFQLDKNFQIAAGAGYLFAGKAWSVFSGNKSDPLKLHIAAILSF
jgi:hypothetical protein